ncbi:hypothetical protein SG34_009195 [Thalassomonas viridans]|uniref:Uncharacterized protein n=1 Tax=Thalassomonas viridans TaxID=137584 RepID=A0AAE9Z6Q9_9GAMM|nr:hypothetical protein [Thalassomonas viridans]WDE07040.1 hypothetical protein SG34_009195 [Thalassomonas viridans]
MNFKDTQDIIRAELGAPDWFRIDDDVLVSERWDKNNIRIHVFYSQPQMTPEIISYEAI